MPRVFPFLLAASISWAAVAPAASARDALSPQEAATIFFESVYRMDYVQSWQILTAASQEGLIKLVLETEKKPGLQAAEVRRLFESGDRAVLRGFWTQMRQHMAIELWIKQGFGEPRNATDDASGRWVKATPADVLVYVRQENQRWKFGFVESFIERRKAPTLPGSSPTPAPAKGSP
ncbi:MAG: hypothetical protein ACO1RX_13700 [Candidatus Sericytochromatia bacterium]